MNLIPSVSEYDLYLYVFHPGQLGDEKREYIAGNKSFEETINYFKEFANAANETITEDDKTLIRSKISVYGTSDKIFYLNPVQHNSDNAKKSKLQYRAASVEVTERVTAKTFVDNQKLYMVKVNITDHSTRIYIFASSGEPLHNITLKLQPGGTVHELNDNLEPLVIPGRVEVGHISLEIGEG